MLLKDFDFFLPEHLIAQRPLLKRSSSLLLVLDRSTGEISHRHFTDLTTILAPGDLLVMNNSKVIPARLFAHKVTGGKVEILIERILDQSRVLAQTKSNKTLKLGERLIIEDNIWFEIINRQDNLVELELKLDYSVESILAQYGHMPLPPYIKRSDDLTDQYNYQTIYAEKSGSVAAPTAGLHFDQELLSNLRLRGIQQAFVTLHVGLGTFKPIRVEDCTSHKMHPEYLEVTNEVCDLVNYTKSQGKKVVAVGSTTLRALESASLSGKIKPYFGDTNIFIYGNYNFVSVDALITNFHLPKTTLLMLVCAFGGYDHVMQAYQEAIKEQYRFYSYGDAMIILN